MSKEYFKYTDHPSLTVIAKKPRLRIFEDFSIEEKLPKFTIKVAKKAASVAFNMNDNVYVEDETIDSRPSSNESPDDSDSKDLAELKRVLEGIGMHTSTRSSARWDRERYIRNKLNEFGLNRDRKVDGSRGHKRSLLSRLKDKFMKVDYEELQEHVMSIEESFKRIKDLFSMPSCDLLEKHKHLIDAAIERLKNAGQYSKATDVDKQAFILAYELTLAKDGRFSKYLTEDQIVELMLKSEKGINVEFLRYYNELMPTEVVNLKMEADKLCIFDNYAVIHYDKTVENLKRTVEKEEETRDRFRRRDPILVGLIQGSRKLYYIADWVTPEDDLTIAKVEELLGIKAPIISAFDAAIKNAEENERHTDELLKHLEDMNKAIVAAENAVADNKDL